MDLNTGMAIVSDAITGVVDAAEPLVLTAMPLDRSPGMAEISIEHRYRATPDATPVTNTYAYASLLGYGAVDGLRALAILLRAPVPPVWAPLVNARATVEAAARMHWLAEAGITVEARVQRGMVTRLHNARQQLRAPDELASAHERGRAAVKDLAAQAAALGWTISGKKQPSPRVGTEVRPESREAIDQVLRYRGPERNTEADLTWWFYSGVMHANPFAFIQFVAREESVPSGVAGLNVAPIYVSGRQFLSAAATAGRATINATAAYARLLGVETTNLEEAERQFSGTIVGAFRAMDRSEARS